MSLDPQGSSRRRQDERQEVSGHAQASNQGTGLGSFSQCAAIPCIDSDAEPSDGCSERRESHADDAPNEGPIIRKENIRRDPSAPKEHGERPKDAPFRDGDRDRIRHGV